jgi:hemerythrin-like domain-containing protein
MPADSASSCGAACFAFKEIVMRKSIRIIHEEHRSMSAVLHGLLSLARTASDSRVVPEFPVFHAMIHYIDAFPERQHHPKEDDFLFSRLAVRAPEARALIEELRAEHVKGARLVRELESALLAWEVNGKEDLPAFGAAIEAYARFHWDHMRKEEQQLVPMAERFLTEDDWRCVDEAFAGNEDPIADLRAADFEKLYQRIVGLAPDPVGLGGQWKKRTA